LPAVSEAGAEILFRLCVLNSVSFLVPTVKAKEQCCCNGHWENCNKGFSGALFYCVLGLVLPHFVTESKNLKISLCFPAVG
jgi:hypothetical protein